MTDERYYAEYFRVAFYGNFPAAMRNKQFVVRIEIPLQSRFFVTTFRVSIAALSGRNWPHFARECSTSTQERSCSELKGNLPSTSGSERTNISNVPPWFPSQTAPCQYSLTWTCHSPCGPITSIGLSSRFLPIWIYVLTRGTAQ